MTFESTSARERARVLESTNVRERATDSESTIIPQVTSFPHTWCSTCITCCQQNLDNAARVCYHTRSTRNVLGVQ